MFIQKRNFRKTENNKLFLRCRAFIFKKFQITRIKGCIKIWRRPLYRCCISSSFMLLYIVYPCAEHFRIILHEVLTKFYFHGNTISLNSWRSMPSWKIEVWSSFTKLHQLHEFTINLYNINFSIIPVFMSTDRPQN